MLYWHRFAQRIHPLLHIPPLWDYLLLSNCEYCCNLPAAKEITDACSKKLGNMDIFYGSCRRSRLDLARLGVDDFRSELLRRGVIDSIWIRLESSADSEPGGAANRIMCGSSSISRLDLKCYNYRYVYMCDFLKASRRLSSTSNFETRNRKRGNYKFM